VDPFDGGPYYEAVTDDVAPIRGAAAAGQGPAAGAGPSLVGWDLPHAPWFRAMAGPGPWGEASAVGRAQAAGNRVWETSLPADGSSAGS
jgi:hypothetical protein